MSSSFLLLPPTPPTPQLLLLGMMSHAVEHPFGQLESAIPAVSPPNVSCTPSLLAAGAAGETEKGLALCEHCRAELSQRALISPGLGTHQNHSPMGKLNSAPAKTSTTSKPAL